MFILEPRLRRAIYVIVFEIMAIALSTILLMVLSGSNAGNSLPAAVAVSVIAIIWNYIFNTMFEAYERRLRIVKRTLKIRSVHAVGFELGLFIFTIPLYMVWYHIGFAEAFMMEVSILFFFLFYTFVFTLVFDAIFPLPQHPTHHKSGKAIVAD